MDHINKDEVIKKENSIQYRYIFGEEKWFPTYMLSEYDYPDSIFYDMYEEIDENEAFDLIKLKREQLLKLEKIAYETAKKAHENQFDKGGKPYFEHPLFVSQQIKNIEGKIVALLHDICEDTDITLNDLLDLGFTLRIVQAINVLSRKSDDEYEQYLQKVKSNYIARIVKISDIKHNMDITRIQNPTIKDHQRILKYEKALSFLEDEES